jgi:hypothetical protein
MQASQKEPSMRAVTSFLVVALVALAVPAQVEAKIALNRAVVVEVHPPGSAKGMKHGAVTLVRLMPYVKKGETITTPLRADTEMTRLSGKEREKIALKDLKPGMVTMIHISAERKDNEPWQLDALHVLGSAEDADPALVKILGQIHQSTYVRVTKVGPPLPEYKEDVGRVEVILAQMPYILRVTRRTEIVWQTADAKRTPATLEDIKTIDPEIDVAIYYPAALAFGEPPVVPVTLIMLNPRAKKPR